LTFGVVPARVDLINNTDGVTYEEARRNVVRGTCGKVEVTFIGFDDLIKNKKATPKGSANRLECDDLQNDIGERVNLAGENPDKGSARNKLDILGFKCAVDWVAPIEPNRRCSELQ